MASDLHGKRVVITGANTGIGRITATELARRGARVTLACRSRDKTAPVIEQIKRDAGHDRVDFVALDLGELAAVRRATEELLADPAPIDLLIANAGVAGQRGTTKDGFELAFGTNHVGHYLFTRALVERVRDAAAKAGAARIVFVASHRHYKAKRLDLERVKTSTPSFTGYAEYDVSKLCNVLFARELGRRLAGTGVSTYAVHPGAVATDITRRVPQPLRWTINRFLLTPEQGAVSSLRAATDPALASASGEYYDQKGQPTKPSALALDDQLATTLWDRTAAWTGLPA